MMSRGRLTGLLSLFVTLAITAADAQEPAPAPNSRPDIPASIENIPKPSQPASTNQEQAELGRASILELFRQANPLLWPLVVCSIVTVGFAMERLVALRRRRVVPRDFVDRFLDRLESGKLDQDRALELCRTNDSAVARVFARVVKYWGQPASSIREAVSREVSGEIVDMKRNVRVLNATATLAPLLGLLGTVFGLIEAFDALGNRTAAGVGKSEALAHGISLALMATAFGLAIAILSVTLYYYLLNRIDVLLRMIDREAGRVVDLVAGDMPQRLVPDYRRTVHGHADLARHDARGH